MNALNTKNTNLFSLATNTKEQTCYQMYEYLTFLNCITLEAKRKNIEAKLSEKEKEIQLLRQRDSMNADAIASLSDQLTKVMQEIENLKKQN